jgi:outer membrane murein-binding lipoprotein Lpp
VIKAVLVAVAMIAFVFPVFVRADEQKDLEQKIEQLSRELEELKAQVEQSEEKTKRIESLEQKVAATERKSIGRWLTIGGDYRFRFDNLQGEVAPYADGLTVFGNAAQLVGAMMSGAIPPMDQQSLFGAAIIGGAYGPLSLQTAMQDAHDVSSDSLYTNRFGLNLKAKATEDVTVTARLVMYKIAGAQDDRALQSGSTVYSFDRAGLFDGTLGHVPADGRLLVDRAYATWNNIGDQPIWFSIGRRPSTGGAPSHLEQNLPSPGVSGVPAILVDYAFDGVSLGWAPDIEALPGASLKFCYGRGFQDAIENSDTGNGINSTDMIGIDLVAYETDRFRAQVQYNRGMDIFDAPIMLSGPFPLEPSTNLGDIDWYSLDFMGMAKKVGPGNLNWFVSGGLSQTKPNGNTLQFAGLDSGYGLLFTGMPEDTDGWAVYAGGRYDLPNSRTKIGFEYNHGSENWITFTPAADDMWTAKLGVRGDVYETYIIKELALKPISSYTSKAFFKFGYQYYSFDYTGSNSWLGAPIDIDSLTNMTPQLTAPLKSAQDFYATFEVHF